MRSRLNLYLDLLHECDDAALATQSVSMPGFPFASALPFAPDERHLPVFLISRLAEHTQNLLKDERASLLLRKAGGPDAARVTLVGRVRPLAPDNRMIERFLRYQPDSREFLLLGDFAWFRLEPQRVRTIGGFAAAGWLEAAKIEAVPSLSLLEEAALIGQFQPELPATVSILGIDPYGIDLRQEGLRRRLLFKPGPILGEALAAAISRSLATLLR